MDVTENNINTEDITSAEEPQKIESTLIQTTAAIPTSTSRQ